MYRIGFLSHGSFGLQCLSFECSAAQYVFICFGSTVQEHPYFPTSQPNLGNQNACSIAVINYFIHMQIWRDSNLFCNFHPVLCWSMFSSSWNTLLWGTSFSALTVMGISIEECLFKTSGHLGFYFSNSDSVDFERNPEVCI